MAIGLDEQTMIVVQENWFTVRGESYVVIWDTKLSPDEPRMCFLKAGDIYDFIDRDPLRRTRSSEAFDVARRPIRLSSAEG